MVHPRTAHARNKKESKREIRTVATRSACKRVADCANRTSWFNVGETIDLSPCFFLGSHFLEVCRELKDYFSTKRAEILFSCLWDQFYKSSATVYEMQKRIAFESTVPAAYCGRRAGREIFRYLKWSRCGVMKGLHFEYCPRSGHPLTCPCND